MVNPIETSCLILAEGVFVGIPGSMEKLRRVLTTIKIDESLNEMIIETIGIDTYKRLVAPGPRSGPTSLAA